MVVNISDVLQAVISLKDRLITAQRNSKTAAHICEVVAALEPILRNLEASPDLQEPHIQASLRDLKVFVDSDLDTLSQELAAQWDIERFVFATGNEDKMKNALERLNSYLNYLHLAINEASHKAGRVRDEAIIQQNQELKVPAWTCHCQIHSLTHVR